MQEDDANRVEQVHVQVSEDGDRQMTKFVIQPVILCCSDEAAKTWS